MLKVELEKTVFYNSMTYKIFSYFEAKTNTMVIVEGLTLLSPCSYLVPTITAVYRYIFVRCNWTEALRAILYNEYYMNIHANIVLSN